MIEAKAWEEARADAGAYASISERGGLLLGYRRGQHLHVDFVTTPGPADQASRFAFRRGTAGHQSAASQRWLFSGGTSDWLGEWHSHPEAHPQPSGTDIATWHRLVREARHPMAFVIFGYVSEWVCIVYPRIGATQRLILIEDSPEGKVFGDQGFRSA